MGTTITLQEQHLSLRDLVIRLEKKDVKFKDNPLIGPDKSGNNYQLELKLSTTSDELRVLNFLERLIEIEKEPIKISNIKTKNNKRIIVVKIDHEKYVGVT